MFKSVNWVAIPGYDLFFQDNLAPGERLTRAEFDAVERLAITKGIYKGVTFHRFPGATSDTDLETFWREQVSAPIWRCDSPDRSFARGCP